MAGRAARAGAAIGASIQHLVNNGYAVYAINNRGSSGYGKTFFHMDDRRHGDVDLRDVVASRDWLAGQDWVSDRVAVMGGSYGGYMTAAALWPSIPRRSTPASTSSASPTGCGRSNRSPPGGARSAPPCSTRWAIRPPTPSATARISPLFHAANIRRPMLVVQGANDPRVLQVESDELVAAVRANNVPVEYVVFPDEGHGFLRKENRINASEAYLRFLDQHLRLFPLTNWTRR